GDPGNGVLGSAGLGTGLRVVRGTVTRWGRVSRWGAAVPSPQVQPREPGHAGALCGDAGQGERLRPGGQPGCAEAQEERPIRQILYLGELLETCHFQSFWQALDENMELLDGITGFEDSVRKFICHVVGITYQHIDRWLLAEMLGDLSEAQLKVWMSKYGWTEPEPGRIFICNQEESIKPKNIVEKIDFDSVSSIMASSL
uniref:Eukaryotic translation initiation factor 3 subunit K n=1 Tax=Accipiter nisus TaxID=211598 RepID=A0A8B9MF99_9AVES